MDNKDILSVVNESLELKKNLDKLDEKKSKYKNNIISIQKKYLIKFNEAKQDDIESLALELNNEIQELTLKLNCEDKVKC